MDLGPFGISVSISCRVKQLKEIQLAEVFEGRKSYVLFQIPYSLPTVNLTSECCN
jgi:hypothetical protein